MKAREGNTFDDLIEEGYTRSLATRKVTRDIKAEAVAILTYVGTPAIITRVWNSSLRIRAI